MKTPSRTAAAHPGTPHIASLDGIRGLAILLVLFLHFTIIEPRSGLQAGLVHLASLGTHGVDLFFVLSGFLVTRILLEAKGKAHFFKNFYLRRILRIFPLYYFLVIVSFVFLPLLFNLFDGLSEKMPQLDAEVGQWPWYVFFVSNFLTMMEERFTHDILGVAWSLAIEEQFYLVWPWFVMAFPLKHLKKLLVIVILTALLLRTFLWMEGWSPIQIYVFTFTRMDTIAFGALLAVQLLGRQAPFEQAEQRRAAVGAGLGFLLMSAAFWAGWFEVTSIYLNTLMYSGVGFFFYLLVKWAVVGHDSKIIRVCFANSAMRVVGRYSYALYLLHIPVRGLLKGLWLEEGSLASWPLPALLGQGVFYGIAFAATFFLAWLSWNLLEKHFLDLKKYFAS